jgi:predicted nucleic acid-binding protein
MTKSKRKADVPILTETVDSIPLDLPTLTDAIEDHLFTLSTKECQHLAEKLFPELEAAFLEALSSNPQADWEAAMQQVKSVLPKLIRKAAQ